jgi:hypothetical protein
LLHSGSLAIVLLPNLAALTHAYGQLLANLAVFALLIRLAALTSGALGPLSRSDPLTAVGFRRSAAAENMLIFGGLSITAIITTCSWSE